MIQMSEEVFRAENVMINQRLDKRAIERVSGPAWSGLRNQFIEASNIILDISDTITCLLPTIYVKFQIEVDNQDRVLAVIWLKKSSEMVIGFSHPENYKHRLLHPTPMGMVYAGLNAYFILYRGEENPPQLTRWAKMAFNTIIK